MTRAFTGRAWLRRLSYMVALNVTVEGHRDFWRESEESHTSMSSMGKNCLTFILFGSVELMRMEQFASALSCSLNAVNGPFLPPLSKSPFHERKP